MLEEKKIRQSRSAGIAINRGQIIECSTTLSGSGNSNNNNRRRLCMLFTTVFMCVCVCACACGRVNMYSHQCAGIPMPGRRVSNIKRGRLITHTNSQRSYGWTGELTVGCIAAQNGR